MSWFNTKCSKWLCILAVLIIPAVLQAQDNVSAKRPFGQHTVAFTATPTFDAGTTENWVMTITGNVTGSTLIGAEPGMFLKWKICQDGVGSHTFSWPSQLQNPITIVATANTCTTEIFYFDGTNGFIPVTTTSGGGGSGTVNGGTVNQLAIYTASTTVSSDANLDDGLTTANTLTYGGTGGISAKTFNATGTGAMSIVGTEGTCSGAASGKDVICIGDLTSHSIQWSLNGGSFFPGAQHQSTSPTPHGIMVAETFPQMFALPRGAQGQALCEGAISADPGYCSLNLAGGSNIVQGILPKVNIPTTAVYTDQTNTGGAPMTLDMSGSTTAASAFRVPNKAGLTTALNGAHGYDTTSNNHHFGTNSADSIVPVTTITPTNGNCANWVVVSGNIQLGQATGACGTPGGSPPMNNIISATGANSGVNNGDFKQTFNWSLSTSGNHALVITENSASTAAGTPYLFDVHSIASSTANPFIVTALGTANGWNLLNSGALFAPVGSGALAIPGTAHGVVINQGAGAATTLAPEVAAGKVLIDNGPGQDPSFQDPVISQAFVNLFNTISATGTQTSSNARNPVFSQTGTLQITWASITGSPASCTLQIQGVDSLGNALNDGSTFSVSPANGTTSQTFTSAASLQTAAQVKAIYACVTYPSTGTLSLDFTPIPNVNVTNTVAVSGTVTSNQGTANATPWNENIAQVGGTAVVADPCQANARSSVNINQTAGTQLIAGTALKQTYVCSIDLITATAQNIALVEGTGTVCSSSTAGMAGGATAATGWNLAANGGLVKGTGNNWVYKTATAADNVCILQSGSGQISGSIQYVQQ